MRYAITAIGRCAFVSALAVWASSLTPFAQPPQHQVASGPSRQPIVRRTDDLLPRSPLLPPADVRLTANGSRQLSVRATMSNGQTEDVTRLVKFTSDDEAVAKVTAQGVVQALAPGRTVVRIRFGKSLGLVRVSVSFTTAPKTKALATSSGFAPVNFVDELAAKEWESVGLKPVGRTSDSIFARRLYQHLVGRLPTVRELRRFWKMADNSRRARLIDQLLEHPDFARSWRDVWGQWLFRPPNAKHKEALKGAGRWLRKAMAENRPLDRLVRELLTAQGDPRQHGAAAFYIQHDSAHAAARAVSRRILGGRMDCARCHPHPSQAWTPEDWRALEACFAHVKPTKNAEGVTEVVLGSAAKANERVVAGIFDLRFQPLGPRPDPREDLADWLTREGKLLLARGLVNRYWRHLFNRGLVEPFGDLRSSREATLPAVLEALAHDLVKHRFDAKHLLRTICRSGLYQMKQDNAPAVGNDRGFHARYQVYRVPYPLLITMAHQTTLSQKVFTDLVSDYDPDFPWFGLTPPSYFLGTISRPQRSSVCEDDPMGLGLSSALHMINSAGLQGAITDPRGRVRRRIASGCTDERIIEELFLATLSRRATKDELRAVRGHLAKTPGPLRRNALEDILWALINTKEFVFVH